MLHPVPERRVIMYKDILNDKDFINLESNETHITDGDKVVAGWRVALKERKSSSRDGQT